MKGHSIRITSESQWHALRMQHCGGSDVASLLGVNPTKSRYELWVEKSRKVEPRNLDDDERVYFGKLLEPVIAKAVAERTGWTVKAIRRYISGMPDSRLGGSLDREVYCPDRGWGTLELKTADYGVFRKWDAEEGAPTAYQLQLQAYLGLTGRSWGAIAVLVGGNRLEIYEYDFRPGLFDLILAEVEIFWVSVENGEPPEPDFDRDARLIALLHRDYVSGKSLDLDGSDRAIEAAASYIEAQRVAREADKAQERAKSELFTLLGDAEVAKAGKYEISSSLVIGKPDWHVGMADLGRVIKGRSPYRKLHVREKLP